MALGQRVICAVLLLRLICFLRWIAITLIFSSFVGVTHDASLASLSYCELAIRRYRNQIHWKRWRCTTKWENSSFWCTIFASCWLVGGSCIHVFALLHVYSTLAHGYRVLRFLKVLRRRNSLLQPHRPLRYRINLIARKVRFKIRSTEIYIIFF